MNAAKALRVYFLTVAAITAPFFGFALGAREEAGVFVMGLALVGCLLVLALTSAWIRGYKRGLRDADW